MTSIQTTITEQGTIALINAYCKMLGVKPTTIIALAMRKNLPELRE